MAAGDYHDRAVRGKLPRLLDDVGGDRGIFGAPSVQVRGTWGSVGLGALQDLVQEAFGSVALDRSKVKLEPVEPSYDDCAACEGKSFTFPAGLEEAREDFCGAHKAAARAVNTERLAARARVQPRRLARDRQGRDAHQQAARAGLRAAAAADRRRHPGAQRPLPVRQRQEVQALPRRLRHHASSLGGSGRLREPWCRNRPNPRAGPRVQVMARAQQDAPAGQRIDDSILDAVGRTPLVRLSRLAAGLTPQVVAKVEYLNPGGSIKDRVAVAMIEAAERDGLLKPGGTIVEPTSGNTGTGLAIAARLKGYRVIAVMPDKQSKEKMDLLRAYGAEVVVTPSDVAPDSPESYYKVAERLASETPGAFRPNQYSNTANPEAHYRTTGPELWEQTGGAITHLVVGVGTGGTITGTGRYLKERNPDIQIVGADPAGSIYTAGDEGPRQYLLEGVGEDFWPDTFDPSIVDRFVKVSDRDAFS